MMKFSYSEGSLTEFLSTEVGTLEDLGSLITVFHWSSGIFKDDYRKKDNFQGAEFIGLDVDEGCTLAEAQELFKNYKHIIATSKSHQKEKNGIVCDRFRVILFFSELITDAQVFESTWFSLFEKFSFIDPACKDASRFYYPSVKIISLQAEGELVSPVLIKDIKNTPKTSQKLLDLTQTKLSRKTLDFLTFGAPEGSWNVSLFTAAKDWLEQGLDQDSFEERAEKITGHLDAVDKKTIDSAFSKEPKYLPRGYVSTLENQARIEGLIVSARELGKEALTFLGNKELVKGEPTGLVALDEILGGGKRLGELTVTHAEAGTGKNTLWHYLIYLWAMQGKGHVGYASRELSPENEVIPDFLSLYAEENARKVDLTPARQEQYTKIIEGLPIYFATGYGYFPEQDLVAWVKALKERGVNYFYFDHLHYMLEDPEDHKAAAKLIRDLKALVKDENIHVDLIIQPNKLMEGQRLSLNSIKGGAAMGQAIDNLIIMERATDTDVKNVTKVTMKKGRSKLCRPGSFYVQYNPENMHFQTVELEPSPSRFSQESNYDSDYPSPITRKLIPIRNEN
jgi:hypothetical protein